MKKGWILPYGTVTAYTNTGERWAHWPGLLQDIAAGPSGYFWGIGLDGDIR